MAQWSVSGGISTSQLTSMFQVTACRKRPRRRAQRSSTVDHDVIKHSTQMIHSSLLTLTVVCTIQREDPCILRSVIPK